MQDIGGVWRTIGGRRVFIKTGQSLSDAMIESGKFKKPRKLQDKIMNWEQKFKRDEEIYKKLDEIHERTKKEEQRLTQLYNEKKIDPDEYEKKWMENNRKEDADVYETARKMVYDSRKEEILELDRKEIFTDERKKYKESKLQELTQEQKNAITDYTGSYTYGSSDRINTYLNEKYTYLNDTLQEKMKENIRQLDTAMSKAKIGGNYQLYRGIEPTDIGNPEIANAIIRMKKGIEKGKMLSLRKQVEKIAELKGMEIETKGFMSTSKNIDPNYTKRGLTLVINTKPDDRAIDVSSLSKYNGMRDTKYLPFYSGTVQTENEVLYDRDTTLKIKDVAITDEGVFLLADTKQKKKY